MVNKRPGRPRGDQRLRSALIEAAYGEFTEHGYGATTVRAIAARADCDHAMVNYYFGSKAGIFAASFGLPVSPRDIIRQAFAAHTTVEEIRRRLPRVLVYSLIQLWEQPAVRERALPLIAGMIGDPQSSGEVIREFMQESILRELSKALAPYYGGSARLRAAGIAMAMSGAVVTRYVIQAPTIAELDATDLCAVLERSVRAQL